mmetsp:Transcript_11047/g.23458  ORF Transcript_11047/g.23458 Transcript_11047/m.23458 type:complete len:292 (-) Transcript_11047:744-1619(-)
MMMTPSAKAKTVTPIPVTLPPPVVVVVAVVAAATALVVLQFVDEKHGALLRESATTARGRTTPLSSIAIVPLVAIAPLLRRSLRIIILAVVPRSSSFHDDDDVRPRDLQHGAESSLAQNSSQRQFAHFESWKDVFVLDQQGGFVEGTLDPFPRLSYFGNGVRVHLGRGVRDNGVSFDDGMVVRWFVFEFSENAASASASFGKFVFVLDDRERRDESGGGAGGGEVGGRRGGLVPFGGLRWSRGWLAVVRFGVVAGGSRSRRRLLLLGGPWLLWLLLPSGAVVVIVVTSLGG